MEGYGAWRVLEKEETVTYAVPYGGRYIDRAQNILEMIST